MTDWGLNVQQAINLRAFFRVSVTCNDEPENLMGVPPLNGDIGSKILIIRASRFKMPMATVTAQESAPETHQDSEQQPDAVTTAVPELLQELAAEAPKRSSRRSATPPPEQVDVLLESVLEALPEAPPAGVVKSRSRRATKPATHELD